LVKIGLPISIGESVQLINDLIKDTIHQECLVAYKQKKGLNQSEAKMGQIGPKCWKLFLKRKRDKIKSSKGRIYELDWSKWTR
jgi:hypothetical protein